MRLRPAVIVQRKPSQRPVSNKFWFAFAFVAVAPIATAGALLHATHPVMHGCNFGSQTLSLMGDEAYVYPDWRANNPGATCPTELSELEYKMPTTDEWGRDIRFHCEHEKLVLWSAGPDAGFTNDDLHAETENGRPR
jgi:hypothetical protein